MYDFAYSRPASLTDAQAALAKAGDDGVFMAGGQSLIPTLKLRLRRPAAVVDLGGLPGLDQIAVEGDRLVIGALATHAAVAASQTVREKIPALAALAGGIGDPQVRNRGTLGGSIANADPAADYPAAIVGLDAEVITDKRTVKADDFFTGLFETALRPGEIVTAVKFRIPEKAGYAKFPQPASHFALVGVLAAKFKDGARVAVTGAGPSVFRMQAMEKALAKDFSGAALGGITVPVDDLNSDLHADAAYRAHLVGVMAARAVNG